MAGSMFPTETQAFLKALASEVRQQIMQEFAAGETLAVGDIAARLSTTVEKGASSDGRKGGHAITMEG